MPRKGTHHDPTHHHDGAVRGTTTTRTLFSRASLAVRVAASDDRKQPDLHRVHLERDGTAVAGNGQVVMAVGPVDPNRASYFPPNDEPSASPPPEGVGVPPSLAHRVERSMPASASPSLQFFQIVRCDTRVELMTTNGTDQVKQSAIPQRRGFPNWRKAMRAARSTATSARVVVDAKSMIKLLQAILKATQDPGKRVPVEIRFGGEKDALVLRAENPTCRQRIAAYVQVLDVGDEWLTDEDEWEAGVFRE